MFSGRKCVPDERNLCKKIQIILNFKYLINLKSTFFLFCS